MIQLPSSAGSSELEGRRIRGIGWSIVAAAFGQGSTFFANIALANILGRSRFGEFALVLSASQVAAQIAGLGMGFTAIKYLAEFRLSDPERAARILGFTLLIASGMALLVGAGEATLGSFLANAVLRIPELSAELRLAGGICCFMAMNGFFIGAMGGLEQYRPLGVISTICGIVYFVALAVGGHTWGLAGATGGLFCATALQTFLLARSLWNRSSQLGIRPRFAGISRERSVLTRFAVPAALAGLTAAPSLWIGQAVLTRRPDGVADVALYAVSASLLAIVMLLPSIANTVAASLMNNVRGSGHRGRFAGVYRSNVKTTLILVVCGGSLMAAAGPLLLRVFGESFVSGFPVLIVLLFAAVPESLSQALYQGFQANERMWHALYFISLPRDMALAAIALVVVPRFGAMGLALAYVTSRSIGLAMTIATSRKLGLADGLQALRT